MRVCKHAFVKIWVFRSSHYSRRVSVTLPVGHFYVEKNISVCTTRWNGTHQALWKLVLRHVLNSGGLQGCTSPTSTETILLWQSPPRGFTESSTIHSTVALLSTSEILASAFPKDCIICTSKNKGVFCCCCVYVFACIAWDGQLVGSPAGRSVWKEQKVQRCKPKRNSGFLRKGGW